MIVQICLVLLLAHLLISHWKGRKFLKLGKVLENDIVALPFIGHMYKFSGDDENRMDSLQRIGREALKYGGITSVWVGRRLFIVSADPDIAKFYLKSCHEKDSLTHLIQSLTGNGSIFAPVNIWRPRRKVLHTIFSQKNLEKFVMTFAEQSRVMVDQLKKEVGRQPFSLWTYMGAYTMDAICETTLGVKLEAQKNPDQQFLKSFEKFSNLTMKRVAQPWLHINWVYNLTSDSKLLNKCVHYMQDFVEKIILDKRKQFEESRVAVQGKVENNIPENTIMNGKIKAIGKTKLNMIVKEKSDDISVIKKTTINGSVTRNGTKTNGIAPPYDRIRSNPGHKTFLELVLESSNDNTGLNDQELKEELLVMINAGTDTSAAGNCFTALMLARHPEVQEKVYEELHQVFGESRRLVTPADLPRLKYLEAVIKETLRLYPPAPITTRVVTEDITLPSGITLPAGCGILTHQWAVHRNPAFWGPDAEVFRPERFLDIEYKSSAQFMPFGYGIRNCIGYQYAMMSAKTALATLMLHYKFVPAEATISEPKPLRLKFAIMMKDVDNFMVRLEGRK